MDRDRRAMRSSLLLIVPLIFAGCATRGYVRDTVREEIAAVRSETEQNRFAVDDLRRDVGEVRSSASLALTKTDDLSGRLGSIRELALDRAGYSEVARSRVYFAFDSDELNDPAVETLRRVRTAIEENPQVIVGLYGYADPTGPETYNLELGRRRAETVLRYLVEGSSLPLNRFALMSYGENLPADEAGFAESEAERRQVLVLVMEKADREWHEEDEPTVSRR